MIKNHSAIARRLLIASLVSLCAFALLSHKEISTAQSTRPVLISEANSTRAVFRVHRDGGDVCVAFEIQDIQLDTRAAISAESVMMSSGVTRRTSCSWLA